MVDWVLRMARVPAGDFLDVIAARGGLTPALLDALADAVAAYHRWRCRRWSGSIRPRRCGAIAAWATSRSALDAGLPEAAVQRLADAHAGRAGRDRAWLAAARARRLRPPRAWRSASGQSLSVAGPAGAVRRAGIRRGDGDHRPRLRPGVPADGPRSPGRSRGRQPGAEPLCRAHRRRRADPRAAGVPVAARDGPRACRGEPRQRRDRARAIWRPRRHYLRRRRRSWWRSAACPAPASRRWRARWRRSSAARPARWCCAATKSASASTASRPEQRLPQSAYSDAASEAVFAELAALVRETAAGGHAVIADATFIDPRHRTLIEAAARAAGVPFPRPLAGGAAGGAGGTHRRPPARRVGCHRRGAACGKPQQSACRRLAGDRCHGDGRPPGTGRSMRSDQ